MIQAFKHDENNVLAEMSLEQLDKGSWINCAAPSQEELSHLNELNGIPVYSQQTAIDREERSHVEIEDDNILLVVKKFLVNTFTSFRTYKKTRFLFQILSQASSSFLFYLQQIYKQTDVIETQVRKSLQNKELFRLLELQKSLTYFNFALHANENVMERLMRLRNSPLHSLLKMYEEDEDLLEDVIIENKQALEMAEIYTNILMSMMDSFSSIISNRLSQIMKFLTSVTIILATPTLIYSLWGINVPVPFESSPFGFVEVTLLGVAVTVAVTFVLWKKNML